MRRFIFICFLVILNMLAIAQDKSITGVVTTFDSIPLIKATVYVKSSKQTLLTDSLGRFTLLGQSNEKLKVSANGFYRETVKISGTEKYVLVNLRIKPGIKNTKTAIGYGHVKDKDKLNAVVSLSQNDMDFSSYNNMYDLIQGKISGVQIKDGEIWVRGVTTSSKAGNAALIIVDGIAVSQSTFAAISPGNVKRISVVKDGSAAIYGSRAANGVVLVETKK